MSLWTRQAQAHKKTLSQKHKVCRANLFLLFWNTKLGADQFGPRPDAFSPPSSNFTHHSKIIVVQIRSSLHEFFVKVFAKGFLENDEYFRAHVTAAKGIPLEAFIQAPQIQEITNEIDLIRHTILVSKVIYIHEDDTVRAIVKPEQNILILRDIPSSTPSDDIIDIFTRAGMAVTVTAEALTAYIPIGVRAEIGDTWFITFASDANARAALKAIQHVRFGNRRLSARLKTTTAVKPIYTGSRSQQSSPEMGLPGGGPGGLGGGGPSPPAQGGMYSSRRLPDFYSGPVSPDFASSMMHGMPPPMFFQPSYMGAPIGPGGLLYGAMPLGHYPPHMMGGHMGPPMGGGGGMGGVKGMLSGQWGSPTNQGQGQGMGMGGPMGPGMGGPRGQGKARRAQGQGAPYPYDPSLGQGQGQWASPAKAYATRGQYAGNYTRPPNQGKAPMGLGSHSNDAAEYGYVYVGGNGNGGEGNGRGGRLNRLRPAYSAGVMEDNYDPSFSQMGPGGHAPDGDGAVGRRQARDRDNDGILASGGSVDADDQGGAGSAGEGEGGDGSSDQRRGKKPSPSGGLSEGSHGQGGEGKLGQGGAQGQRRDPLRTQQPRDPSKQRQTAPRKAAQPDFDLSADFPTLPGEGGQGGTQAVGGGGGEGSPSPSLSPSPSAAAASAAAAAAVSAAAAGPKPVFGYAAALRRGPEEGGAQTAASGPSSSSSSAPGAGAGAGAASAPSPADSDVASRRDKTAEAGTAPAPAPTPTPAPAPASTPAPAVAAASLPQSKAAGRAPAWGQHAPPVAPEGASRQADGGDDVPSVTFGNFGPTPTHTPAPAPAPTPAPAPAPAAKAEGSMASSPRSF